LFYIRDAGKRGKKGRTERERLRRGEGKEEGKREEVNQFESPGSDPAARERSAGQIAPYSFGYNPIRYTGRKAPESHVRAEWRQPVGFLAPGFPGVSTDRKKCVWLLAEIALRENENVVAAATAKLTRGRRDGNISSVFSGDVEETKGIGSKEKG